MKKIEKIIMTIDTDDLSMRYYEGIRKGYEKINELVDAVNELKCYEHSHDTEGRQYFHDHTQEPEIKEEKPCHWCGAVGDEEHGCGVPEKEPECKHEYNSCANNERPFCGKCGRQFGDEKPAKKDELAERLEKAGPKGTVDNITFYKAVADEAQKWAVEQVEKAFYDTDEQYDGVLLDEVLARLKEAK